MIIANCDCLISNDYCTANSLIRQKCNENHNCLIKQMIKEAKLGRNVLNCLNIVEADNV